MAAELEDTYYSITIPSTGQKFRISREAYEQGAENMFRQNPDAQVTRVTLSGAEDDDINDRDRFQVKMQDGSFTTLDAQKYSGIRDKMFADYPNAKVYKVSDISWQRNEPSREEARKRLEEFDAANGEFMKKYEFADEQISGMDPMERSPLSHPQYKFWAENDNSYRALQEKRNELRRAYYSNPNTVREMKEGAEVARIMEEDYRKKAQSSEGYEKKEFERAAKLMGDVAKAYEAPEDNDGKSELAKYWQGAGVIGDLDIWFAGARKMFRDLNLADIRKKIEKLEKEKGSAITESDYDSIITEGEKALLKSAAYLAEIQAERSATDGRLAPFSSAYTAGQGFAQSIPFMLEFLLSEGMGSAVAKGVRFLPETWAVSKGLVNSGSALTRWIGKNLLSERSLLMAREAGKKIPTAAEAFNAGGKVGKALNLVDDIVVRPLVKGLWHTATQPRIWATYAENLNRTNDNNELMGQWEAFGHAFWDNLIENWSESVGSVLDKGTGWIGGKILGTSGKLGKTSFGRFTRWMFENQGTKTLADAGFNGLLGEMAEEWIGNAVRVWSGEMTGQEFAEFASWKQQLEMAASFAPMSIIGLGTSAIAATRRSKMYRQQAEDAKKWLPKYGASEEDLKRIFNTRFDTPEDIAQKLAPYAAKMFEAKESGDKSAIEDYKKLMMLSQSIGENQIAGRMEEYRKQADRQQAGLEIVDKLGRDFIQTDENGNKTVTRIEHPDGRTGYVVGKPDQSGEAAVLWDDGSTGFSYVSDDAALTSVDGIPVSHITSVQSEDEYLDGYIAEKKNAAQQQRKEQEEKQNSMNLAAQLQLGATIPMGTVENPVEGRIIEVKLYDKAVIVQTPDGNSPISFEEAASRLGMPLKAKTDDQITADMLEAEDRAVAKKKTMSDSINRGVRIPVIDGYEAVSFIAPEAQEDGSYRYPVIVKAADTGASAVLPGRQVQSDDNGQTGIIYLTEQDMDKLASMLPVGEKAGRYNEKIESGTPLEVSIPNGEENGSETATINFTRADVEDGQIMIYGTDAQGKEVAVTEDMVSNLPGVLAKADETPVKADEDVAPGEEDKVDDVNPLADYMRTNSVTGGLEVDSDKLWNENPEKWCEWNDTDNADPYKASTKDKLKYAIGELSKKIDKLAKTLKEGNLKGMDGKKKDELRRDIDVLSGRRSELQSLAERYTEKKAEAQPAEINKETEAQATAEANATSEESADEKPEKPQSIPERLNALGGYLNFKDFVLRSLALGGTTLKWGNSKNGEIKGLGSHLGFSNKSKERNQRIWLLNNKEGKYPEVVADELLDAYAAELGVADADAVPMGGTSPLDVLLEVILESPTRSAMVAAAESMHASATGETEASRQQKLSEEIEALAQKYGLEPDFVADVVLGYVDTGGQTVEGFLGEEASYLSYLESDEYRADREAEDAAKENYANFVENNNDERQKSENGSASGEAGEGYGLSAVLTDGQEMGGGEQNGLHPETPGQQDEAGYGGFREVGQEGYSPVRQPLHSPLSNSLAGRGEQGEVEDLPEGENVPEYSVSSISANKGGNFIQNKEGSIDLIRLAKEVLDKLKIKDLPLRLTTSMVKHIFEQHKNEGKFQTEQDAIRFVVDVMTNFDHVRQGDGGAFIFSVENGRKDTGRRAITIILESDSGDYLGVKTAGYERLSGMQKRPLLWEKGVETSAADTASANVTSETAQQGGEQNGNASNQSEGLSESKDSENSSKASTSEENKSGLTDAQKNVLGWLEGKTPEQVEAEYEAKRKAEAAARAELERKTKAVEGRIAKWKKLLGDAFVVHTDISTVENKQVRRQIEKYDNETPVDGKHNESRVRGWYDTATGEAHIYIPHILEVEGGDVERDVNETILHECLAHKGIRGLLKTEEQLDKFFDDVWKMMEGYSWRVMDEDGTEKVYSAREYFLNYVNETGSFSSEQQAQRAAADEFVAHCSEVDQTLVDEMDKNFWQKVLDFLSDIIKDAVGMNIFENESRNPFAGIIRQSLAEFTEQKRKADEEQRKQQSRAEVKEDVLGTLDGEETKATSTRKVQDNPQVPISQSQEKYEDFGEKIGMARKDTAKKGIKRGEADGRPSWAKKYDTINVRMLSDEEIAERERSYLGYVSRNFEEVHHDITKGTDFTQPFVGFWTEEKKTWNGTRTVKHYITDENRKPIIFTSLEQYEATMPVFEAARAGFRVREAQGKFYISKQASNGKMVEYAEFDTREEAAAYLASPEGATDLLNRKRENYELPALTELTRNGMPDYRGGKDVTPDDFQKTFGFRGGEFGNWLNAEERRQFLNYAYDALMDLANILHISPQALSLGGELSIAFGARGTQGARAHYESTRAVINLTKMNGAGSLAHEWAHALDNYFGMMDAKQERVRDEKQGDKNEHFMSEELSWKKGAREEVRQAVKAVMETLTYKMEERAIVEEKEQEQLDKRRNWLEKEVEYARKRLEMGRTTYDYNRKTKKREEVKHTMTDEQLEEFDRLVAQLETDPTFKYDWDYTRQQWRGQGEVADKIRELVKEIMPDRKSDNPLHDLFHQIDLTRKQAERLQAAQEGKTETLRVKTEMLESSEWFDRGRASSYYAKPLEMFARAFETYVAGEMKAGVQTSDYLTYEKSPLYMAAWGKSPYPMGAERVAAKEAFDKLFHAIQEKTDEKTGKQVLFSKVFSAAKERFGTTYNLREAGFILPDGTMLDFSGRHYLQDGEDSSFLDGRRTVDHKEIEVLNFEKDGNTPSGMDVSLPEFIKEGAIRIDSNAGAINLAVAPTDAQRSVLSRLIGMNDGYVWVDFGDGYNSEHYVEYEGARPIRVLNDITRYFNEGYKPESYVQFSRVAQNFAEDPNLRFSIRVKPAPKKTGIGYKVFFRGKDGKLYPPMVANPNGADTPVGVWLDADAAPVAATSKTGRPQVKAGGKGTQGGSGLLAYRPGWHLGEIPYAIQFNRLNPETGEKDLFPKDFVWAEVEYAADKDYQADADKEGTNKSGKYQHSLAGLKRVPEDGFYRYRTNPNPETDPWIITGSMKVNRVLTNEEVDDLVRTAGREPQKRESDVRFSRKVAEDLVKRYDEQDGERYPWMSEGELISTIEEELPYEKDTEDIFSLVDKYNRLDEADFDEGRRDFSGADRDSTFEDIMNALRAYSKGEDDSVRFSFIGQDGAHRLAKAENDNAIIDNLEAAIVMEGEGKDAAAIKFATGWERGADEMWRYELPDVHVKKDIHSIIAFPNSAKLEDVLEDDDAFRKLREAYPSIAGITVHSSPLLEKNTLAGYNDYTDAIVFNSHRMWDFMPDELRVQLVHEIQHSIQKIEGFARGASYELVGEEFESARKLSDEVEKKKKALYEAKTNHPVLKFMLAAINAEKLSEEDYEAGKAAMREGPFRDSWDRLYNTPVHGRLFEQTKMAKEAAQNYEKRIDEYTEPIRSLRQDYIDAIKAYNDERMRIYRSHAGEVEARNVERRLNFTEEGRRSTAESSEDIPRKDQIISFDNVSSAMISKGLQETTLFKEDSSPRFSLANENQRIFISNAEAALGRIKMDKATPQQWMAMLQKEGGLKAGEDKWLGLSDWLQSSDKKTLTKQEVADFIAENQIQIEEEHYSEDSNLDENEKMLELRDEFYELVEEGDEATGSIYVSDHADWAFRQMVERYGDDFEQGFEWTYDENRYPKLVAIEDIFAGGISEAARYYLGIYDKPIESTRLDYTTEGLSNKREIALTVPKVESYSPGDIVHFGDAGEGRAVAWIRFGEANVGLNKRALVIDEIQSKRHQDGRVFGYKGDARVDEARKVLQSLMDKYEAKTMRDLEASITNKTDHDTFTKNKLIVAKVVPDAPFEKNWQELAMKRMLRLAAEEGYDVVAWATGDQQAERYNIGNAVESIEKLDENTYRINTKDASPAQELEFDEDGVYRDDDDATLNNKSMSDIFGKELAKRLRELPEGETLKEDGLRIGGEGMRGFYDQMLVTFMNKYGKKWGVKVEDITLNDLGDGPMTVHSVRVTPEMKESVMQGQVMFSRKDFGEFSIDKLVDRREKLLSTKPIPVAVGTIKASDGIRPMEAAYKWYDENIGGHRVYSTEVGDVTIDKESIQESLGHKFGQRKLDAVSSLFSGFENATYITSIPDMDGKPMLDHYFAYPIQYDGETCYVLCRAREDVNKNRLYIHEVFPLENIKSETLQTPADQSQPRRGLALYKKLLAAVIYDKDSNNSENDNTLFSRTPANSKAVVERVSDRGIGAFVGKDNVRDLLNGIYQAMPETMRREIVSRAMDGDLNIHTALKGYLTELAEKGFENDETGMLRAAADMIDGYSEEGAVADDATKRYLVWKLGQDGRSDILERVSDIALRNRWGAGKEQEGESGVRFSLKDDIESKAAAAEKSVEEAKESLDEQKKVLKGKLLTAARAMASQKEYDQATVETVTRLAKDLLKEQGLDGASRFEVGRILGIINSSVGKSPAIVRRNCNALLDIIIDRMLKNERAALDKLTSIKATKTNTTGVEVQGALDLQGQTTVKAFNKGLNMQIGEVEDDESDGTILGRMSALSDRLSSEDDAVRNDAVAEYTGLQLAKEYLENIQQSESEEDGLENELKDAQELRRTKQMSSKEYSEFAAEVDHAIRENRIARIEAYREMQLKMQGIISGSRDKAAEFREKEQERIQSIHHLANSDMEGRKFNEHEDPGRTTFDEIKSSSLVQFLASSLATFDQMLRLFGRKSTSGEGYLFNKFMRSGWTQASEEEYLGNKKAKSALDKKVSEVFGKKMRWSDLYEVERKMPKVTITWWDGGEMKEHELTQGNLLYIYMVNKMSDGRMKLRRMGIKEEDVQAIVEQMDERFIELADWMQEEFLVELRNKYNEVHERVFGASMAAIEDYFPHKINKRSLNKSEDVGRPDMDDLLPATTTGSIIKRRRNSRDLDLIHADAFSVVVEHIEEMEKWAAFAELRKDVNTLISYKHFRNQVINMSTVYGEKDQLWKTFVNTAKIAVGTYKPATDKVSEKSLSVARNVSMAKIAFRLYTAIKQLLSMPAFIADANIGYLIKNMSMPWVAWNWAMENLPLVEKRWKSRQLGDTRLTPTKSTRERWWKKMAELVSSMGMTPNVFIDALTVSIGSYSIYQTKYNQYITDGYSEEQADKRAKQDATILYNETQQSSEGAFVSQMQLDQTWHSVGLSVYRNASMGYQRQLHDALRNIGKLLSSNYKEQSINFMTKQMMRDGLTEEQAHHAAERRYGRALVHNAVRVATFWYILPFLWNLGSSLIYQLFGDDDDKKEDLVKEASIHALVGGWAEGLAGGNIVSEAANMVANGESFRSYNPSLMPITQDILNLVRKIENDKIAAASEIINLVVQMKVGFNPQTFTDAIVALVDAAGGNMDTSKEALMFAFRVMQVPQSQLDEMLIDELGINPESKKDMDYWDIAERYARYKTMKNAPATGWLYSEEAEQKREDAYLKQFDKKVRAREDLIYNDEEE